MARLDDLLQWVHDDLPAVPQLLAQRELREAARAFCYYSTFWRDDLDPISVRAGADQYDLDTDDDRTVVSIVAANLSGTHLEIISAEKTARYDAANVAADFPLAITVLNQTLVRLVPAPTQSAPKGLQLRAAFQPSRMATELPDHLVERYGPEIGVGAKARLMRKPNHLWSASPTAPAQAAAWDAEFRAASARARRDVESAFCSAQTQVTLRRWI